MWSQWLKIVSVKLRSTDWAYIQGHHFEHFWAVFVLFFFSFCLLVRLCFCDALTCFRFWDVNKVAESWSLLWVIQVLGKVWVSLAKKCSDEWDMLVAPDTRPQVHPCSSRALYWPSDPVKYDPGFVPHWMCSLQDWKPQTLHLKTAGKHQQWWSLTIFRSVWNRR